MLHIKNLSNHCRHKPCQFHELFLSYFWRVFAIRPDCGSPAKDVRVRTCRGFLPTWVRRAVHFDQGTWILSHEKQEDIIQNQEGRKKGKNYELDFALFPQGISLNGTLVPPMFRFMFSAKTVTLFMEIQRTIASAIGALQVRISIYKIFKYGVFLV